MIDLRGTCVICMIYSTNLDRDGVCMICMICTCLSVGVHDLQDLYDLQDLLNWTCMCVPEWDLDVCDLYTFTGWDLYDELDISHVCT